MDHPISADSPQQSVASSLGESCATVSRRRLAFRPHSAVGKPFRSPLINGVEISQQHGSINGRGNIEPTTALRNENLTNHASPSHSSDITESGQLPKISDANTTSTSNILHQTKTRRRLVTNWVFPEMLVFYEGLKQHGKDFDAIAKFMAKKKFNKDKDQIRNYYFNAFKIWKLKAQLTELDWKGVPRDARELFVVLNGCEWRKKTGGINFDPLRFRTLILEGATSVRVKKKLITIRTPFCSCLLKFFPYDKRNAEIPTHLCLKFTPYRYMDRSYVLSCEQNPLLQIRVNVNDKMSNVFALLERKWSTPLSRLMGEINSENSSAALRLRVQDNVQIHKIQIDVNYYPALSMKRLRSDNDPGGVDNFTPQSGPSTTATAIRLGASGEDAANPVGEKGVGGSGDASASSDLPLGASSVVAYHTPLSTCTPSTTVVTASLAACAKTSFGVLSSSADENSNETPSKISYHKPKSSTRDCNVIKVGHPTVFDINETKLKDGLTRENAGNASILQLFYLCGMMSEITLSYELISPPSNLDLSWRAFTALVRRDYGELTARAIQRNADQRSVQRQQQPPPPPPPQRVEQRGELGIAADGSALYLTGGSGGGAEATTAVTSSLSQERLIGANDPTAGGGKKLAYSAAVTGMSSPATSVLCETSVFASAADAKTAVTTALSMFSDSLSSANANTKGAAGDAIAARSGTTISASCSVAELLGVTRRRRAKRKTLTATNGDEVGREDLLRQAAFCPASASVGSASVVVVDNDDDDGGGDGANRNNKERNMASRGTPVGVTTGAGHPHHHHRHHELRATRGSDIVEAENAQFLQQLRDINNSQPKKRARRQVKVVHNNNSNNNNNNVILQPLAQRPEQQYLHQKPAYFSSFVYQQQQQQHANDAIPGTHIMSQRPQPSQPQPPPMAAYISEGVRVLGVDAANNTILAMDVSGTCAELNGGITAINVASNNANNDASTLMMMQPASLQYSNLTADATMTILPAHNSNAATPLDADANAVGAGGSGSPRLTDFSHLLVTTPTMSGGNDANSSSATPTSPMYTSILDISPEVNNALYPLSSASILATFCSPTKNAAPYDGGRRFGQQQRPPRQYWQLGRNNDPLLAAASTRRVDETLETPTKTTTMTTRNNFAVATATTPLAGVDGMSIGAEFSTDSFSAFTNFAKATHSNSSILLPGGGATPSASSFALLDGSPLSKTLPEDVRHAYELMLKENSVDYCRNFEQLTRNIDGIHASHHGAHDTNRTQSTTTPTKWDIDGGTQRILQAATSTPTTTAASRSKVAPRKDIRN